MGNPARDEYGFSRMEIEPLVAYLEGHFAPDDVKPFLLIPMQVQRRPAANWRRRISKWVDIFATRLSAGGVADHFVTLMLRQGDAEVFKRYSQAKLNMMREALDKLDRRANEHEMSFATARPN